MKSEASASVVASESRFSSKGTSSSSTVNKLNALAISTGEALKYKHQVASNKAHVMGLSGFKSIKEVKALAQQMMLADDDIEYVEPDYLMFPSTVVPSDPGFIDQWHLQDAAMQGLNLPKAWLHTTGSSDVVVAVVDTGILAGHEDFDSARILQGYDFVSADIEGTFVAANDGDGRDNNPSDPGDWVTQEESDDVASPMYECPVGESGWHGTHVAGTVGANTDNGFGVSGVDWAAKILPVRVMGKCGGYNSDIADGIIWAAGGSVSGATDNEHPADIINLSLGSSGFCSSTLQSAIDQAFNSGAAVVVAAGNESSLTAFVTPASCDNVIVVGAHDNEGQLSDFSNYGSEVDVLAPGGSNFNFSQSNSVLSLSNAGEEGPLANGFAFATGTSMAAPHVSGLAALMLSINPDLTPTELEQLLKTSAREFGSNCSSSRCGSGIVDAEAAVLASAIPDAPSILTAQDNSAAVLLSWQDNTEFESGFKIEYANNGGAYETVFITQANVTAYEHVDVTDGLAHYRLTAVNGDLASSSIEVRDVAVAFKTISRVNVSATSNAVSLTWQDNSIYENGVEIYRAIENAAYELLSTAAENAVSFVDDQVEDGQFYRYQLRAIKSDEQGELVESEQIQTPLFSPSNLHITLSSGEAVLTWQDNSQNESAYQVERSNDGVLFFKVATLEADIQQFSEANNQSAVSYYRVKALSNKTGSRSIEDEPASDSAYSNVEIVEQAIKSKSGAFSMIYVALLFLFGTYRRPRAPAKRLL